MKDSAADDPAEAASRVQVELIRAASPERRLEACLAWSGSMIALNRALLRDRFPELGEIELGLKWVELQYGRELSEAIRSFRARRG